MSEAISGVAALAMVSRISLHSCRLLALREPWRERLGGIDHLNNFGISEILLDGLVETGVEQIIPSHTEGRFAIVTDVGAGCGGREWCRRRGRYLADGEVVWS
jgi:hypothetical protein